MGINKLRFIMILSQQALKNRIRGFLFLNIFSKSIKTFFHRPELNNIENCSF